LRYNARIIILIATKRSQLAYVGATEQLRLAHLYEQLRLKLLDLSKRNRMLNYIFSTRSKRYLQIVDEVLEEIYRKLGASIDKSKT
jgi:hypothetical protein